MLFTMDTFQEKIDFYKKITIKALFSVDELSSILVLKGGSALSIYHEVRGRRSIDLDFSMDQDQEDIDLIALSPKCEAAVLQEFKENGYHAFDFKIRRRPKTGPDRVAEIFWSGYDISFKIIKDELAEDLDRDLEHMRRQAELVSVRHTNNYGKKLEIDISRGEFCASSEEAFEDLIPIRIYTLAMIVIEKLRSICQKMKEYPYSKQSSPRTRDFFDIYQIMTNKKQFVDLYSDETVLLIKSIFDAKDVDLALIDRIPEYKEFHRTGWEALVSTIDVDVNLKDFDFYFDFVVDLCRRFPFL